MATAGKNRWIDSEKGGIPFAGMFILLFMLFMIALVGNIGRTARNRVAIQNTADAVAYSGAIPLARAMNTLVTCQHLAGEIAAIGAMHAALDGIYPDGTPDTSLPLVWISVPPGLINAWQVHYDKMDKNANANQEAHDWFGQGYLGALIGSVFKDNPSPKKSDFDTKFAEKFMGTEEDYSSKRIEIFMSTPTILVNIGYQGAQYGGQITGVYPDAAAYNQIANKNNSGGLYDTLGGAIGDADRRLKIVLFEAYIAQFYAALLWETSDTQKGNSKFDRDMKDVAIQIANASLIIQKKAYLESKALDELLNVTRATVAMKAGSWSVSSVLDSYAGLVVSTAPDMAREAMDEVDQGNEAEIFPTRPSLPVVREPSSTTGDQSHLTRSMTPWVQYHRQGLLQWGQDSILLGRFKDYYWRRTVITSAGLADRLKTSGRNPYIMMDNVDPSNHRNQAWRTNSNTADLRFGLVGLAWKDDRSSFLPKLLPRSLFSDSKVGAYSQAMLYAANPLTTPPATGYQDNDGWDTLVWTAPTPAHPGPGYENTGPDKDPPLVTIAPPIPRANWQVRLVPASRAAAASQNLTNSLPQNLKRISTLPQAFLAGH